MWKTTSESRYAFLWINFEKLIPRRNLLKSFFEETVQSPDEEITITIVYRKSEWFLFEMHTKILRITTAENSGEILKMPPLSWI